MGVAVGAVQFEKGAGHGGGVGGRQAQVAEAGDVVGEDGVGQRLAHVGHQPFGVAGGQFRDVEAEFLRQRQDHRGGDRAVVVLHLVQIGQETPSLAAKSFCVRARRWRVSRSLAPA